MAVHHSIPTCPYCDKPLMKAIHKNESDLPQSMKNIGDNVTGWESTNHFCIKGFIAKISARILQKKENGGKTLLELVKEENERKQGKK